MLSGETSQEAVSSIMYKTHVTTHAMLSSHTTSIQCTDAASQPSRLCGPRVRSEGSDPRGLGVRRFSRRNTCHCAFWHVPLGFPPSLASNRLRLGQRDKERKREREREGSCTTLRMGQRSEAPFRVCSFWTGSDDTGDGHHRRNLQSTVICDCSF